MNASESASDLPTWIACPAPLISVSASGLTGRRKVIDSSAVVNETPAANSSGQRHQARRVGQHRQHPARDHPIMLANHGEAGIVNPACPLDTSLGAISVR